MEISELFGSIFFISFIVFIWFLFDRKSINNELIDTRKTIINNVRLRKLSIYILSIMLIAFVILSIASIWSVQMNDRLVRNIFSSMGVLAFAIIMINIFNNIFKIKE